MKTITSFGLLILVASMVLGGMTSNVLAQDDPRILLKIAEHAQEQINNQLPTDSSDKIKRLFEEGTQKVDSLEKALGNEDIESAKEYFLSAMRIFTEISRQLTPSDVTSQTKVDSMKTTVKDPSNDLQRLQGYINSLKTIAKKHNASIDFSESDELFFKAKQQISDHQFVLAFETIYEIKETIVKINKELREEASKQESQRAKEYAKKYLEQLDRLIENTKKQGIADEIIEKLEISKENLSLVDNPSEIIQEIRKIKSIKDQFQLTENDGLESRVLQVEKTLSRISQLDGTNQSELTDARTTLQSIKHYLSEGEFDIANNLLEDLIKQLKEIKNFPS